MIEQIGGRKFVFAALVVVCGFFLAAVDRIDFDQFVSLALWALGIFSVSNAVQKVGAITVRHKIEKEK